MDIVYIIPKMQILNIITNNIITERRNNSKCLKIQ